MFPSGSFAEDAHLLQGLCFPEFMFDFATFFLEQVEASSKVQFVYNLTTSHMAFVNSAYERVLGGHAAQVNAELPDLLARIHPDDRAYLAEYWHQWGSGQSTDEVDIRLQSPGQPDQWFTLHPSYQQASSGNVWLSGTLHDITVTKEYQHNADLFNSRKNATLDMLSHDLSGAFILVEQISQYLHEEIKPAPSGTMLEMLDTLASTSQDSVKMIRDLINLEFLTSANSALKRDRVNLNEVLREPLEQFENGQRLTRHHFSYALGARPVYVDLDVNKFAQVLINLVNNAIKFTPDTGTITVRVEPGPGTVRVLVQDNGVGIPPDLLPQVFDRFTPARREGLRGEHTTGLGLATCKAVVELHHGILTVESTEGEGSTFTVELPLSAVRKRAAVGK
jgi:two-component system sensor histidine kinase VicK